MYQRGDSGQENTNKQTKIAGNMAEAIMMRQLSPTMFGGSGTSKKARSAAYPNMMLNAVHICHCITNTPQMAGGAVLAA
jgi:hypothetical protein